MSDYRFHLEKYRPNSKLTCPQCKKLRCLVHYVDDQGITMSADVTMRTVAGITILPKTIFMIILI